MATRFRGGAGLPLAGGGGSRKFSWIHSAVVTLNNAEIKALTNTPVEVIPDPGVGKIAIPTFTCILTSGFAPLADPDAYTGMDADGYIALRTTSPFADIQDITVNDSSIPLTNFTDLMLLDTSAVLVATSPLTQGFYQGWGIIGAPFQNELYANKAIYLSVNNNGNTADLGGGRTENTMSVSVLYVVLDLATGAIIT